MRNDISVDEVLALLGRTALPTIVIEGTDDMLVYRTFESSLEHLGISVLPVGGRQKLLEVFRRKDEIDSHSRPLFIADSDTWVILGVPPEYRHESIVFTDGFSIENDLYLDGELWELVPVGARPGFLADVQRFIEWYALALHRHLQDPTHSIRLHPSHVLDPVQRRSLLSLGPSEAYPAELRNRISSDYERTVRGKSLLQLLVMKTAARLSTQALLAVVAIRPGRRLQAIRSKVEEFFGPRSNVIA